jgi:hypothetical protein
VIHFNCAADQTAEMGRLLGAQDEAIEETEHKNKRLALSPHLSFNPAKVHGSNGAFTISTSTLNYFARH